MTKPTPAYLTISVDDGHPTDLRTAELLSRYGVKATFYIPAHNPEREVMPPHSIREVASAFEIGGHTKNHRRLDRLPRAEVWREVTEGKAWLEDLLSTPTVAFCYPRGKHNRLVRNLVRRAGFLGGRTTVFNVSKSPRDPFRWGVSTHAYSHSRLKHARMAIRRGNFAGLRDYVRIHHCARSWVEHFRRALDWVEVHGGIAHLYLHSWEIDEYGEWQTLDTVLRDAATRNGFTRVTNGELFAARHNAM